MGLRTQLLWDKCSPMVSDKLAEAFGWVDPKKKSGGRTAIPGSATVTKVGHRRLWEYKSAGGSEGRFSNGLKLSSISIYWDGQGVFVDVVGSSAPTSMHELSGFISQLKCPSIGGCKIVSGLPL